MVDAKLGGDVLARLARSVQHWEQQGCQFVSLPWLAPAPYLAATKPDFVTAADIGTPHGFLLASGEQAFLMLQAEQRLPAGEQFIGWTPCFRDEAVFDQSHHFYFMKAEVFELATPDSATDKLANMLTRARAFFMSELCLAGAPASARVEVEYLGPAQQDLLLMGLEVGSYGIRQFNGQTYVYGTACAEPRFSLALERALSG